MLWGVVLLFEVKRGSVRPRRALGACLIFGAAATRRTEANFYLSLRSLRVGFLPSCRSRPPRSAASGLVVVVRGTQRRARFRLALGTGTLPVVWFFQYSGGARPQWGGRYVLLSGVLLAIVGVVVLARRPAVLGALLALSVAVTGGGAAYLS